MGRMMAAAAAAWIVSAAAAWGFDNRHPADSRFPDGFSRSSVVVLTVPGGGPIPAAVEALHAQRTAPAGVSSPAGIATVRGIAGGVLLSWFDPVGPGLRFGVHNDYLSYFGDGWEGEGVPQWHGDPARGMLWASHEFISGEPPHAGEEPHGAMLLLARFLYGDPARGDGYWSREHMDAFAPAIKRELGGSFVRIERDPKSGRWRAVADDPANRRYDATSGTLLRMTGPFGPKVADHDDDGNPLPPGIVAGTVADCSGGTTPWGTVLLGEENTDTMYASDRGIFHDMGSPPAVRHDDNYYQWPAEVDPAAPPGMAYDPATGKGHAKHSSLGQGRWENFSFRVGADWQPPEGKPLTVYYADDRYRGRLHKFVSKGVYRAKDPVAKKRVLLTDGTVYVSHLAGVAEDGFTLRCPASPSGVPACTGRWDEVPTDALTWLHQYENDAGIPGQNRPEDVEFDPSTGRIYVAYTKYPDRGDPAGRIWAFTENGDGTLRFWEVAAGNREFKKECTGFANPDNLLVGRDGSLWFATDGQTDTDGCAASDGFYRLFLKPDGTGVPYRILAAPEGAEVTGPAFNSDMTALFLSIQHPEGTGARAWPSAK